MTGIENKRICLCLNKTWQPIGVKTVKEAFSELVHPSCFALNIVYKTNQDGSFDYSSIENVEALGWNEWLKLPIRECDLEIRTTKMTIRVPTILVSSTYKEVPFKKFKLSKKNIWFRDSGICQYTGRKLEKDEANIDHIVARSRGGVNSWENMVLCHKDINSKKGRKTPEEAGLKLIRKPKPLLPIAFSEYIDHCEHVDWNFFINK